MVAQRWLDQVGRVIGVPFERGCEFYNIWPSVKYHLNESNWPLGFSTGGATGVRPGPIGVTLWTKQLRARYSSVWHHCDLMTGMDCIICDVLWILHLSRKTEAENTILLARFYEITAWGNHFWGYVYIYLSVYEREKREHNYSSILGEAGHRFIRFSMVV